MKRKDIKPIILLALLFCITRTQAQNLIPQLKVFEPIVNQDWIGNFDDPEETMDIYENTEVILNGSAIRRTRTVPAAENFRSETLYYWDPEAKVIAFIQITNNGYLNRGTVTPKDTVLLCEGNRYGPDGSYSKTKSETIFQKDGTYIEKGGHTIIFKKKYSRSNTMKKSNQAHKKRFTGRIIFFIISSYFILTSCNYSHAQSGQYKYHTPSKLNDGWEVASLQDVGIDAEAIETLTRQILTEDRFESLLSMLIVKDGKLVHEVYSPYVQRNTLHWMASITKTFTSTLIGIAIDQGFIRNVHTSVQDLLPDYADAIEDPDFKTITLRHLMTMSSGLDWMERVSYNDPRNSEHQMVDSEDWIRFILSHRVQDTPGTRFLYNTGGMHLLSAVIKSVTGLYANEFAEKYLLHPMGIRAYQRYHGLPLHRRYRRRPGSTHPGHRQIWLAGFKRR